MNQSEKQVRIGVLMPHAPVLVPAIGGKYGNQAAASVGAMAEAARRVVKAAPETVVLISPHSPRRAERFAIWDGDASQRLVVSIRRASRCGGFAGGRNACRDDCGGGRIAECKFGG